MKQPLLRFLSGTVLTLGLSLAPLPSAFAGQDIVINTLVEHSVYGNGDPLDNGNAPTPNKPETLTRSPDHNSVTVESGGVIVWTQATLWGAFKVGQAVGGYVYNKAGDASATDNRATLNSGGEVTSSVVGGYAVSFEHTATATNNHATNSGGKVGSVYGGEAISYYDLPTGRDTGTAIATGNTATISGGTVSTVYGGYAQTDSADATATKNTATISGGTVKDVFGGVTSGRKCCQKAINNTVVINGGMITGQVVGGVTPVSNAYFDLPPGSTAVDNTVILGGKPVFDGNTTTLIGGKAEPDGFTGNTLKVHNYTGTSSAARLANFAFYDFLLAPSLEPLGVTGQVDFTGPDGAFSTVTGVNLASGGADPKVGDRITLIHAEGGFVGTLANNGATLNGTKGTAHYTFRLEQEANRLVAVVITSPDSPDPQLPTFTDGETLTPGNAYTAPSGTPGFCLGGANSASAQVRIDGVTYTLTPRAENTCFEIFTTGRENERAPILASGSGDIAADVSGAPLLLGRNTDLVTNGAAATAAIRATFDPVCTSTRVTRLSGTVSAPGWITAAPPASGCPADALTPERKGYTLSDGLLACAPAALTLKGTYARMTVKQTQTLADGERLYVAAWFSAAGWFQNGASEGWRPFQDPFTPLASTAGQVTVTLVDALDIRGIRGTEVYAGHGQGVEEMMTNQRYCGVFRVAP